MHRAFDIPEILDIILSYANPSLAAAAQTCQKLYMPTVRHLWQKIDDKAFQHLINLVLNDDVLGNEKRIVATFSLTARLKQFRMYSALVQSLHIDGEFFIASIPRLIFLIPDRPLFPHLRCLHYSTTLYEHWEHTLLFINPVLEELVVARGDVYEDSRYTEMETFPVVPALLEALVSVVPRLQKLHLSFPLPLSYNSIHLFPMVRAIIGLQNLISFKIDSLALHPLILSSLADLPLLRELIVGSDDDPEDVIPDGVTIRLPPKTSQISFSSLRVMNLNLSGTSCVALELLKEVPTELEGLGLAIHEQPVRMEFLAELSSLIARFGRLRKIELSFKGTAPDGPIQWHVLSPVLQCREITHFRCDIRTEDILLDLHDSDLSSIAQAWPHLVALDLCWYSYQPEDHGLVDLSSLTLNGLMSLAQHCPHLERVKIDALDARNVPLPVHQPYRNETVELEMDDSRLNDPADVAAFISMIWPNAVVRVASWNKDLAEWDVMNTVLRGVQKVQKYRDLQEGSTSY